MDSFRKKEQKIPACACQTDCPTSQTNIDEMINRSEKNKANKDISIKVLGTGCPSCHALLKNTQEALKNKNVSIEAEYITDIEKIIAYGVMSVPALVVNEKVLSTGKLLKPSDIESILTKLGI